MNRKKQAAGDKSRTLNNGVTALKWEAVSATAVRQNLPHREPSSTKFVATIEKQRSNMNRAKSS